MIILFMSTTGMTSNFLHMQWPLTASGDVLPRGDLHHGLGQAGEEVEERQALLAHRGQGDSEDNCKRKKLR
jgi:hypothetical protein